MKTYLIEEMTWPDIEAAIGEGTDTIIIPIASVEQHGLHLPLITDTLIGEAISVGLAVELGNALVAPVIRPGCSDHHLTFAGSLSFSDKLLGDIIESYCFNLKRYGFRNLVLLPCHGGNFDCVARVAARLKIEFDAKGVNVIALTDRDGFLHAFSDPLSSYGFNFDQVGIHAGLGETSMMMALRPDLVREDRFQAGFVGEIDVSSLLKGGVRAVSENGILGDPRGSTAEMGRKILNHMVTTYADLVRGVTKNSVVPS